MAGFAATIIFNCAGFFKDDIPVLFLLVKNRREEIDTVRCIFA